jgi:hypothetical protein
MILNLSNWEINDIYDLMKEYEDYMTEYTLSEELEGLSVHSLHQYDEPEVVIELCEKELQKRGL